MASQHGVILKIIVNKCYPFVDLKRICQLSVLSPPNWNRSFHVSFVEFAQQKVFNLPLIQYAVPTSNWFFLSFIPCPFTLVSIISLSKYTYYTCCWRRKNFKFDFTATTLKWRCCDEKGNERETGLICVSLKTNFHYGIHWSCRSMSIKLIMKRFAPWSAVHQTSHEPEMKQSNRLVGCLFWTSRTITLYEDRHSYFVCIQVSKNKCSQT
jgi:hypothetical protein